MPQHPLGCSAIRRGRAHDLTGLVDVHQDGCRKWVRHAGSVEAPAASRATGPSYGCQNDVAVAVARLHGYALRQSQRMSWPSRVIRCPPGPASSPRGWSRVIGVPVVIRHPSGLALYFDICQIRYMSNNGAVVARPEMIGREPLSPVKAVQVASVFKALSDPVRLRLLALIACHDGGEACVCDLTGAFEVSAPTISHHLKVLREAGLIAAERRGTWIYYRVEPGPLPTWRTSSAVLRSRPPEPAHEGRRRGRRGPVRACCGERAAGSWARPDRAGGRRGARGLMAPLLRQSPAVLSRRVQRLPRLPVPRRSGTVPTSRRGGRLPARVCGEPRPGHPHRVPRHLGRVRGRGPIPRHHRCRRRDPHRKCDRRHRLVRQPAPARRARAGHLYRKPPARVRLSPSGAVRRPTRRGRRRRRLAVQVAYELAQVATVTLATRRPLAFLPQRIDGRDLHYWLARSGFDDLPPEWLDRLLPDTLVTDTGRYRDAVETGHPADARCSPRWTASTSSGPTAPAKSWTPSCLPPATALTSTTCVRLERSPEGFLCTPGASPPRIPVWRTSDRIPTLVRVEHPPWRDRDAEYVAPAIAAHVRDAGALVRRDRTDGRPTRCGPVGRMLLRRANLQHCGNTVLARRCGYPCSRV